MKLWWLALLLTVCACSKKEPAQVERTEPWLANPPDATTALRAKFVVTDRCEANLLLKAKEGSLRGVARVCRGELDLNLSDLSDSRGTLSVDVASIEMRGDGDAGRGEEQTREAQNWLDVGASRPEAERERLRWATFTITGITNPSHPNANAGRRERVEPEAEEPPSLPDDDADGAAPNPRERRSVTMTARGHMVLHKVRVDVEVPIRATFHYRGRATDDSTPNKVQITTRRPFLVSLAAHDIKPRDAAGVFQAQGMKLMGTTVGADARVSLSASAVLQQP
jgi:hypothetical protein